MKRTIALLTLLGLVGSASAATVAQWRFEEGTAGVQHADNQDNYYLDDSGNGNHLSAWQNDQNPIATASVPFTAQGGTTNTLALDFDVSLSQNIGTFNTNATAKMIDTYAFSSGWTIEASFKCDQVDIWQGILAKDGDPAGVTPDIGYQPFWMKISSGNKLALGFIDDALVAHDPQDHTDIEIGTWYSVAATYDNSTYKIYVRSERDAGYVEVYSEAVATGADLELGATPNYWAVGRAMWDGNPENPFAGIIDEVRISDSALLTNQFINQDGFDLDYVIKKPTGLAAVGFTALDNVFDLSASEYWSPASLAQTGSRWQISASNDFSVIEWDSGVAGATNVVEVPGGALAAVGTYYARVQYQGTGDEWSEWSDMAVLNLIEGETFSGDAMPLYMETTGNSEGNDLLTFGGAANFPGQGDPQRQYLRTKQSNLFKNDFVMEVTHYTSGDGWWEAAWIGMGEGTFDAAQFYGPGGDWIGIMIGGSGSTGGIQLFDGKNNWDDGNWTSPTGDPAWTADTLVAGPTTRRFRLTYTAAIQNMTVEIDNDYVGGAFVADISSVWATCSDGAGNAVQGQFDTTPSHLFFGTAGNGSWFDDLVITPALITEIPAIDIAAEMAPAGLVLSWDAGSLFTYHVLETENLASPEWTTNTQVGVDGTMTSTQTVDSAAAFYKVEAGW